MAQSPNTTNLAVDAELAKQIRKIAAENGMTTLAVTNALLKFALSQNEIKVEVREVTLSPKKKAGGKPSR